MFFIKLLPQFVYPVGLICALLVLALILRQRRRWLTAVLILALVVLWVGSTRWVSTAMSKSLEWRHLPPSNVPDADVILVLEGGTRPRQYPRPTVELGPGGNRLLYAAWLYRSGKAPLILHSGGGVLWRQAEDAASRADTLAGIWSLLGVPDEAVWIEPESRNTYEAAVRTRPMLQERGLDRILLVTSAAHMPRSVAVFEHQGITVIPAPTDFLVSEGDWRSLWRADWRTQIFNVLPQVDNLARTSSALKEYMGIAGYKLLGWL